MKEPYLLVDSRPPSEVFTVGQLEPELGEALAKHVLEATIVGVFLMPESKPVTLVAARVDNGVHYGTYETEDGESGELPIGEVRTQTGRVFKLDE